jgi:hypothetical protein
MADTTVEVTDEAFIEVELPPNLLADPEDAGTVQPGTAKPAGEKTPVAKPATSVDEAAAALTEATRRANDRVAAAEATAAAERLRADNATRLATQKDEEARGARDEAAQSQLVIITNGIEAAKGAVTAAKAAFTAAHEEGNAGKMADAQADIAKAAAALDRLEDAKATFETNATKRPTTEGRVEVPPVADPFEAYLVQGKFTPAAQNWLRQHRDCAPAFAGGNARKNATMMEAHYATIAQGIPAESEEYFDFLDQHIGGKKPTSAAAEVIPAQPGSDDRPAAKPAVAAAPAARRVQPSAPPSRDVPGAPANGRQTVKLSGPQQEVALFSYPAKPGEDEAAHRKRAFGTYATELVKAQAEGKIGRLTH